MDYGSRLDMKTSECSRDAMKAVPQFEHQDSTEVLAIDEKRKVDMTKSGCSRDAMKAVSCFESCTLGFTAGLS